MNLIPTEDCVVVAAGEHVSYVELGSSGSVPSHLHVYSIYAFVIIINQRADADF